MTFIPLDSLKLKLHVAGIATVTKDRNHVAPVGDSFVRLHVVTKGGGTVIFNDHRYELVPGVINCLPPMTPHEYFYDDMEVYCIFFYCELPGGINLYSMLDMPYELPCPDPQPFVDITKRLEELKGKMHPADQAETTSLIIQAQLPFLRASSGFIDSRFPVEYQRFLPALELIEKRLANPPKLSELAKKVCISTFYFSTLFTKVFKLSPTNYIRQRRIQAAKILLKSTTKSIDKISRELGFADRYHFSKKFKKESGISPAAFRSKKELSDK